MTANARHQRARPLDRARRPVRGLPHDHPRPDDRERGPAVDPERLDFSQSSLAWVVNAYLIAFGGLLLLAGRLGDLIGRKRVFLAGLTVFTLASLLCGAAQTQEMLIGARFLQGIGGAMTSAVILGMIVAMFPEPGRAGAGDRDLRVRRLGRRGDRPAGRRRAHRGDQLALDLPRQRSDRHRHRSAGGATAGSRRGHRPVPRRGPPRCAADRRRAHARRLHDRRRGRARLGLAAHRRARCTRGRAARGVHRSRGDHAHAADAAADLPLAHRLGAPTSCRR